MPRPSTYCTRLSTLRPLYVQAAQYNGRIVKIVRTDLEAGRYEVTMFEDEDTKLVPKVRARVRSCTPACPIHVPTLTRVAVHARAYRALTCLLTHRAQGAPPQV